MSTDDGVSDDDEDYDEYNDNGNSGEKRFPIHDACEFGDIDALRKIILEPVVEERTNNGDKHHHHHHHRHHHHHHNRQHNHQHNKNSSSSSDDDDDSDSNDSSDSDDESDENDSTAAAHAAATGHSPLVVKATCKANVNSSSLAAAVTAVTCTIAQTADASTTFSPSPSPATAAVVVAAAAATQADSSSSSSCLQQTKASAAAAPPPPPPPPCAAPALADSEATPRISNASINLTSAAGAVPMPGTGDTPSSSSSTAAVVVVAEKEEDSKLPATAPPKASEDAVREEEGNNMDTTMTDTSKQKDADTGATTLDSSSNKHNEQSPVPAAAAAAAEVASPMDVDDSTTGTTPTTPTPTKDENNHVEPAATAATAAAAAAAAATSPEEASPNPPTPMNEQDENDNDDDDDDMPPPPRGGASPHKSTATTTTRKVVYRVPMNINLNERDLDENTPLHVAIHARKLEHVKLLLELGASYRLRCDGSFPLHTAISMGAIRLHSQFAYECVVALHEAGADLTLKDESNHTPLFLACMFNLPQICSFILSNPDGKSTLNARADRAGNRPLHAAAKYDTPYNRSITKSQAATATGQVVASRGGSGAVIHHQHVHHHHHHHHPDGTVIPKTIPGFPGKTAPSARFALASPSSVSSATSADATMIDTTTTVSSEALLTHVLLGTIGIEIDGTNSLGQTALHVACLRGNWPVTRLLLQAGASPQLADRRGFTPGQLAYKRGMPIPADLVDSLGDPPESGVLPPVRDLIVDPNGPTLVLTHELCILHRTCPPVRRDSPDPPPENVRRLQVLVDTDTGILRSGEFTSCVWKNEARRVAIGDVLKCHEYSYVESISQMASSIPDHPNAVANLDPDTTISRWSFEAAMRAAGSVCQAVDQIVVGDYRNAFCAVRPPGHHAGPRGIVKCPNDPDGGSHGFCLLNNVAIGAAYARSMYRNEGIRKVAIIDFDVHHGNGTEQIIRQLVPTTEKVPLRTPFAFGEISASSYRPWLDETDIHNVFFASTHGYGNRGLDQPGWFYPASGKTHTSEAISHPAMVEHPNLTDFLLSQTWTRMGEDSKANCCKIINVGLELPDASSDPQGRSMKQRLELRDTYRRLILPHLREFDPDLIFISAGFDAHRKDTMNFGYVGMVEDDYEWVTEQLVKIANTCCNGRVISVLEGGYKIHGGIVSPFARSVASHVRALVDGGRSRELYDGKDMEWESQYERHIYERREKKKEDDREKLRLRMEATQRATFLEKFGDTGDAPEDPDAPSRKRRRNQVDYKELFKQMQQEGFANG